MEETAQSKGLDSQQKNYNRRVGVETRKQKRPSRPIQIQRQRCIEGGRNRESQ